MDIAIPLFDRFTGLDAIGPYEVLARLPGARVRFLGPEPGPIATERGLTVHAEAAYEDVPAPEIVVVPGGTGTRDLLHDERLLGWIRRADATARWTTSVCTGSLLLGAAGLLDGVRATTHWIELESLRRFGAQPVDERIVEEGRIITAAGVSAGIDMALLLAARVAGEDVARAIQLGIEYHPEPPFDSGSVATAAPETVEAVRAAATWRLRPAAA